MAQPEQPRTIFEIKGADATAFMQNLVTNDISPKDRLTYAALLTPQGKFIADFFVFYIGDVLHLDVAKISAPTVLQRLTMYKLRADVTLTETSMIVSCGLADMPKGAYADPRHSALGWRLYGDEPHDDDTIDWAAIRVEYCIPETGIELTADSYILECGFERLNGVDFIKGCYVGQEVTARMKHKTELRKGLAKVAMQGQVASGTNITAADKNVGIIYTNTGEYGIAYMRFDRADDDMMADTTPVKRVEVAS